MKIYESQTPGLTIALTPEEAKAVGDLAPNGVLRFRSTNPMIQTDDVKLQKLIENRKEFKKGEIVNLPTAEELKAADRERRKSEFLAKAKLMGVKVSDAQLEKALDAEDEGK